MNRENSIFKPIISSGLIILKQKKILLLKPKGIDSCGHYSIPKGIVEKGESYREAAVRETYEEVGLKIPLSLLSREEKSIKYINKGKLTKIVYCYVVKIDEKSKIPDVIPNEWLQKEEVLHAGFYSKEEAFNLIFWRFRTILFDVI